MRETSPAVRRRRVFYIPGFDPHPSRRYRELYRREGAAQARISGYRLEVEATAGAPDAWEASAAIEGGQVRSRIEVLGWSDIVRATMAKGLFATYAQLLLVVRVYVGTGALRRLAWLGRGPILAGFYPVLGLLLQGALAVLAGWGAGRLAATLLDGLVPGWGALGWAAGPPAAACVLNWARRQDRRLFIHYLMHDLAFSVRAGGAYPPELETRISAFSRRIAVALDGDADEVLVVGHSSGAQIAVSAVAEAVQRGAAPRDGQSLALLTLGQAIPMQSFLPGAARLRRDLNRLSREPRIAWVDISAPGDGCCFALCDAVAVTGVAPERGQLWPLVLSAAFSRTLSEAARARLRHRYFRLHFQYLCAFDRPGDYDYFRVTAGPLTLAERFAGRAPSPGRIGRAASPHVSMAA